MKSDNSIAGETTRLDSATCPAGQSTPTEFSRLPAIIWLRVMKFLDLCDRYYMTLSCGLFHQLFFHPSLWRSVDLVCSPLSGDREATRVSLRPSHKRIALQFGHLFRFVSLHISHTSLQVEEETLQILSHLTDQWNLKGLKLTTEFAELTSCGRTRADCKINGQMLAMHILKKATKLQHLDISNWPIFSPVLGDGGLNLLDVLTSADTCPRLQSLNVARKVFAYHCGTDVGVELHFRQTALHLVSKFGDLRHLHVRQTMLSDELLCQLAAKGRGSPLFTLTVLNCDPVPDNSDINALGYHHHDTTSHLSEASWSLLTSTCPGLEVNLRADVAHVPCITWIMRPHVPLVSVQLLFCSLPADFLTVLLHCRGTLRSLFCHVLGKDFDQPLQELATGCVHLQHLVFYGKIHGTTIVELASLDRQWRTFRFRQKQIVLTDTNDTSGRDPTEIMCTDHDNNPCFSTERDGDRVHGLEQLCAVVSQRLGYSWTPCEL